jgi:hypothetical protein
VRGRYRAISWAAEPLGYFAAFTLIVLAIGMANGGFSNAMTVSEARFTHQLPQDNAIPWLIANGLHDGRIPSPLMADWLSSDRPPLMTGLAILLAPRLDPTAYEIVSAAVQATFLFGVWSAVKAFEVSERLRRLTLLAVCLLPLSIINTFYTWPKMLSVSSFMMIVALLFGARDRCSERPLVSGLLIGALTTLAVLSHGSIVFGLLGLGIAVVLLRAWPPLKTAALSVGILCSPTFHGPPISVSSTRLARGC